MRNLKLKLKFNDQEQEVSIDMKKNILLFGENGSGKTRILDLISELPSLISNRNREETGEVIERLNLEKLEINNQDFSSMFSIKMQIDSYTKEVEEEFVRKNESNIREYINTLDDFTEFTEGFQYDNQLRGTKLRVRDLEHFMYGRDSSHFRSRRLTLINLKQIFAWINRNVHQVSKMIKENTLHNDFLISADMMNKYSNLSLITNKLDILYIELSDDIENSQNNIHNFHRKMDTDNVMEQEKMEKALGEQKISYLSSYTDDLNPLSFIKEELDSINRIFTTIEFSSSEHIYLDFDQNYRERIREYNSKSSVLNSKISRLNKILISYNALCINIINNNIEISKIINGEVYKLNYNILSSGERRVLNIFCRLIFDNYSIFLLDEPEVSLSLSIQNRIVDDIIDCIGEKMLVIATHAPFVFNDFKQNFETNEVVKV